MNSLRLVSLVLLAGCSSDIHPITNFAGHCEAVLSPPDQSAMSSTARYFAPESIRVDFTRWYDSLSVESIAGDFLGGATLSDSVVKELQRLRMIGAWHDGTHLHVTNTLLYSDTDSVPAEFTFDGLVADYRKYLNIEEKPAMSDLQKCLFSAINAYFEDLTIHGPKKRTAVIPTAYYMKSHEQYDAIAAENTEAPRD
jgi:hypothetical protein